MRRALFVVRTALFPPAHGGAKNERQLLRALVRDGFRCHVLVRTLPEGAPRHGFAGQHASELPRGEADGVTYEGVVGDTKALASALAARLRGGAWDYVFAGDDALDDGVPIFETAAATGRFVYLAQTIHCLPFGPFAMRRSPAELAAVRAARAVLAPSRFVADYVHRHAERDAVVWPPDVFGEPPYPSFGDRDRPFVTMINPCPWKGISIFLPLARRRPDLRFAAVPTWGANPKILEALRALPNVTVLPESADVDTIYRQTRVLLVPSLCQEAFGLVSPEALLRGIPVVASAVGGLPESTLGAATLLPVAPLAFDAIPEGAHPGELEWKPPENDVEPWSEALDRVLGDPDEYAARSRRGRSAALRFVRSLRGRSLARSLGEFR